MRCSTGIAERGEVGGDALQVGPGEVLRHAVHVFGDEQFGGNLGNHPPHLDVERVPAVVLLLRPALEKP